MNSDLQSKVNSLCQVCSANINRLKHDKTDVSQLIQSIRDILQEPTKGAEACNSNRTNKGVMKASPNKDDLQIDNSVQYSLTSKLSIAS